jgi:hypothetical protein
LEGGVISAPTGRPPTPTETLAEVSDIVSESPAGSVQRAALHAAYRVALAFPDASERIEAVAELREVCTGRDVTPERFDTTATAALEIAAHRRRTRP